MEAECSINIINKYLIIQGESESVLQGNGRSIGICIAEASSVLISNLRIRSHDAGIGLINNSQATITNSELSSNTIGILLMHNSTATIKNNIIFNNKASGILFEDGPSNTTSQVSHNTIIGNNTDNSYDQINIYRKANVNIKNNVIINGKRGGIYKSNQADALHTGALVINNNDVWNNGANYSGGITDQTGQNGNISVDPKFVSATDFHLQPDSPAQGMGAYSGQ